jgi:CHAD domain-containing protein
MMTDGIREYAHRQLLDLLRRVVFELHRAPSAPGSEAVHDLRVAIRRFLQVAKIFRQFLPAKELKRVRRRLRRVMDASAEVRERDIALEFFEEAMVPQDAVPRQALIRERRKAQKRLAALLARWSRKDLASEWRSALELSGR